MKGWQANPKKIICPRYFKLPMLTRSANKQNCGYKKIKKNSNHFENDTVICFFISGNHHVKAVGEINSGLRLALKEY